MPPEPTLEEKNEPDTQVEPEVNVTETPADDQDDILAKVQINWENICSVVAKEYISEGNLLKYSSRPVQFENGKLLIHVTSNSILRCAHSCQTNLKQAIFDVAGEVKVEFAIGAIDSEPSEPNEYDPVIQLLQDRLGASLIKN